MTTVGATTHSDLIKAVASMLLRTQGRSTLLPALASRLADSNAHIVDPGTSPHVYGIAELLVLINKARPYMRFPVAAYVVAVKDGRRYAAVGLNHYIPGEKEECPRRG